MCLRKEWISSSLKALVNCLRKEIPCLMPLVFLLLACVALRDGKKQERAYHTFQIKRYGMSCGSAYPRIPLSFTRLMPSFIASSSCTRAMRTYPSPWGPKAEPGVTTKPALLRRSIVKSTLEV